MKSTLKITVIALTIAVTIFIYFIFQENIPLVVVASFKSPIYEITRPELQQALTGQGKYKIVIQKSLAGPLERIFALKKIEPYAVAAGTQELLSILNSSEDFLAIIPWYQLQKELRVVRYNKIYFWDLKQIPEDYDLVWHKFCLFSKAKKFKSENKTIVTIGGTVVLSRGIGNVLDRTNDLNYSWQRIAPLFREADLAIINFKSPLTYSYIKPDSTWKLYGKAKYASGLKYSGIDVVSLAGNHIGDAGVEGIKDTLKILLDLGVRHSGLGRNKTEAYQPVICRLPKLTIGFVGLNSVGNSVYRDKQGQSYEVALLDSAWTIKTIKELRAKVDFIIVMPNWGKEYVSTPDDFQLKWGRDLIDNGADLVVGDQAHWVQKAEFYHNKFISYGLGNLIFDQSWSKETRSGVIERFIFYQKKLVSIDLLPVYLNEQWYTDIAQDDHLRQEILKKILN